MKPSQILTIVALVAVAVTEVIYLTGDNIAFQKEKGASQCLQKERAERYQCWEDAIDLALRTKGPDAALETVARFYATQPEFAKDCHSFAHIIGEEGYILFSEKKEVAITPKVSYCAYGFFHGFLESMLQKTGDVVEVRNFCAYVKKTLALNQAEDSCYHGVGHGTTDGSDRRLWGDPQAMANPGLDLCLKIAPGNDQLKSCATGVFNSVGIMMMQRENGLTPDTSNPYALCAGQSKFEYKRACYEQMNTVVMNVTNGDFPKALQYIKKITEADHISMATFSLAGAASAGSLWGDDIKKRDTAGAETCHTLVSGLRQDCIRGYLGGLMEHGTPNLEYKRAREFCTVEILTPEEKDICFNFLTIYAEALYTPEKMSQEVCPILEQPWQDLCQKRATSAL